METQVDPIVSTLITSLIVALVPVLISALIWLARTAIGYLKARATAEQFAILTQVASAAVAAVEQTLASKAGKDKKAAALALVRGTLLSKGIRLDEGAIEAAVEAAVYHELGIKLDAPDMDSNLVDFGTAIQLEDAPVAGDDENSVA